MRRDSVLRSRVTAIIAVLVLATVAAAGCGDDESAGGPTTLQWFIFNEPSGAPQEVAKKCSQESDGRYKIEFDFLPSDADGQREQLVRRLGAEDDSIDLIGMDVIWTGEFANAGWVREVPEERRDALTEGVFDSMLDSARFEGDLFAVPIWSNTQLLWYREDRVDEPPDTWGEMIDQGEEIGPDGKIQVQANRYEGLMVWFNTLLESAGTSFLEDPETVALEEEPTKEALAVMGRLSNSPAADPALTTSDEDTARLSFESGGSTFMLNYPFVFASAKENAPDVAKNLAAAKYPQVVEDEQSAPPLGGINLGVSSFSEHPDLAFEAVECLVQPDNQVTIAEMGGLPPVRPDVYDRPKIDEIYPGFADIIRESIRDATPRPAQSPAYQDLTLAVQRALHPTTEIDPGNPDEAYERLKDAVEKAVTREGLL